MVTPSGDEFLLAWVIAQRWPSLRDQAHRALTSGEGVLGALLSQGVLSGADGRVAQDLAARFRRGRQLVLFLELAARAGVDRNRMTTIGRALQGSADVDTLGVALVGSGLLDISSAQRLSYQARLAFDRSLADLAARGATRPPAAALAPSDSLLVSSAVFRLEVPRAARDEARTIVDDVLSASDERIAPSFSVPDWVDTSVQEVGTRIGPYIVVGRLGQGGHGVVYLCYSEAEPAKAVAVKTPSIDASAVVVGRFKRESLASALFQHENLIEILDAGCDRGRHFLVMEFFDGRDLGKLLVEEQVLAPADALHVIGEVLAGLTAAHAAKVIHRDVKPENVLVSLDRSRVKVMDFGISLVGGLGELQSRVFTTVATGFVGTPRYMSPEQAASQPLDPRSDLYSVGLLLYEALSGEYPYDADGPLAYVRAHLEATPRPLAAAAPWLRNMPPDLHRLVDSLLAKDPDARPRDACAARDVVMSVLPRVASLC